MSNEIEVTFPAEGLNESPSRDNTCSSDKQKIVPYLVPFILITTCFALWGFANDITNPLV